MPPDPIQVELHFDADEYRRAGCCPWTFFAYPTSLADNRGLPPDDQACQLLGHLQKRGIAVGIWVSDIGNNTTYFFCRKEDMYRLNTALQELELEGVIEKDFCVTRSERLFSQMIEDKE
jgi:hypothetical protein